MTMKKMTYLLCGLLLTGSAIAQETEHSSIEQLEQRTDALETAVTGIKKLKVSGYVQGQLQHGQEEAALKVGAAKTSKEENFYRFGIRRGRIKFTYDANQVASGVFQLDVTEKGVNVKDMYINLKDPWWQTLNLCTGLFNRTFGYEIAYSSSQRESPERSTVFQTLFPDERDLGVAVMLQAPKTSPWNILKLEAGMFAGNGIRSDFHNRKDFIGHLSAAKTLDDISLGGGISYYNGAIIQATENVYKMKNNSFVLDEKLSGEGSVGNYVKRDYVGLDFQFRSMSLLGRTQLTAEYLFGTQPGTKGSSNGLTRNLDKIPDDAAANDTYIRNFSGWYVMLVQDFGATPFSVVAKYDVFNPNTKVSGNNVGYQEKAQNEEGETVVVKDSRTSKTDLQQSTLGVGLLYRINPAIKLTAYYEIVGNEKTKNVSGFEEDRKDNVFTLRLQYKF